MTDQPLIGGIDAGTSRIRAIAFDLDGRTVAAADRPTPVIARGTGRAEHDAEALIAAVLDTLAELAAALDDPGRLRSIAVASVGEAGLLVDAAGRALSPIIAWYDTRTTGALAWMLEEIGRERLFRTTGLTPDPTFSLAKLVWLKRHMAEAYAAAAGWLHVADYIAWRLTGIAATDPSLASRTMALDLEKGAWASDLMQAVGVAPALMPEIRPLGARLGRLRPELADRLGLARDCVMGVGGHDHICGAVAIGATRPGVLMDSMGTAEALTLVGAAPSRDPALLEAGFNQGRIEAGGEALYYVFGGLPTSAGAIEWFRRHIAGDAGHAELIARARRVPPGSGGSLFLPHLRLGSPPFPDPVGRGAFLGLGDDADLSTLYRAVLEGVALDGANIVETLIRHLPDRPIERVMAIGGSTRNRLLLEIKAGLFERPVEVAEMAEASALGAAMLGALAAGIAPDLAILRRTLLPGFERVEGDPDWPLTARRRLKAVYARAYERSRATHAELLEG